MKNLLAILQDHLFETVKKLNDASLPKNEMDREIERAAAINEITKAAITEARELL
jgi:hypothetical protein